MKPTQTGIAITLALVVVIMFFVLPSLSVFGTPTSSGTAASGATINNNTQTATTTTMPNQTNTTPPVTQLIEQDEVIGTGATAVAGDTVTVNYVGSLTDGTVFDASADHGTSGFTFVLGAGNVIKGWDEGIVGMKVGGKRKLIIPASLAYGNQAVGNIIPANSTLIFEVELLKVKKAGS